MILEYVLDSLTAVPQKREPTSPPLGWGLVLMASFQSTGCCRDDDVLILRLGRKRQIHCRFCRSSILLWGKLATMLCDDFSNLQRPTLRSRGFLPADR